MQEESPLNPIPPVILALVIVMLGVEAIFGLASSGLIGGRTGIGWRNWAVEDYAFAPRVLDLVIGQGIYSFDLLKRFVTYPFIHASVTNSAFAIVITLAMGKFAGEVLSNLALGILFFATSIAGALVFGLVVAENVALIGAYPAAYGLIGAYTYILWTQLGARGEQQLMAFRLIGVLVALHIVFSVFFGPTPVWIAELSGFATGFVLTPILAPGGWAALLRRLRTR
ncbi:rhomboid family intramembrane serine protease [Roseisalinus antarcticus]|uniref:Rhomboid family protein n=1 Tax=Roseisalinus antarcticus TaxID=254357 RepID=A0A1Y5RRV6_9RHOB|nr:rhomboid family intramembrane serine protease [Roseisalinus antarcticus]SLN23958.1 Rhomboid family protein [Roseisalinus antarcticus]